MAKIYMIILYLSIQLINLIDIDAAKPKSTSKLCTKIDHDRMDNCVMILSFLTDDQLLNNPPLSMKEVNHYCRRLKPAEKCVEQYLNRCTDLQTQQTVKIFLYSLVRTNRKYCNSQKRKSTVLRLVKCAKDRLPEFGNLMRNFTADMHTLRTFQPQNLRIPLVCCNYYKYQELGIQKIQKTCDVPELLSVIRDALQSYFGDIITVMCGDYTDDSDRCDNIIDLIPKWDNKKQLEWKTFAMPLVEIFNSFHFNNSEIN
ncbi:uncharacterized protein LOC113798729 [Dermatophagoides pteronyssinus]|uniref:uncharacterized protein LOC113798729 n=1 Tax=Dermatophagoides pteronyssinus TaxID=6956 RepID=UPI003F66B591